MRFAHTIICGKFKLLDDPYALFFQEKLQLQQEWIENLLEQNEMLVRAVGELEVEATERVQMLEEKLQKSAQCICEVQNFIINNFTMISSYIKTKIMYMQIYIII